MTTFQLLALFDEHFYLASGFCWRTLYACFDLAFLQNESPKALLSLCPDDEHVSNRRVGDPVFAAVQDPNLAKCNTIMVKLNENWWMWYGKMKRKCIECNMVKWYVKWFNVTWWNTTLWNETWWNITWWNLIVLFFNFTFADGSYLALVSKWPGSDPWLGSVRPKQPINSPLK